MMLHTPHAYTQNGKNRILRNVDHRTCVIVGSITNKFSEPAMLLGRIAVESNQKTGKIISGKFLKRYSMPSIFLNMMFSWSLISTLTGIEDFGSTQNELSCRPSSG